MCSVKLCINKLESPNSASLIYHSVWGNVYIKINDYCFPDDQWSDIVSSLLDMWIAEIILFLQNDHQKQNFLRFMDGPYLLRLSKLQNKQIELLCINESGDKETSAVIPVSEFLQSILEGARTFLELCCAEAPYFVHTQTYKRIAMECLTLEKYI